MVFVKGLEELLEEVFLCRDTSWFSVRVLRTNSWCLQQPVQQSLRHQDLLSEVTSPSAVQRNL